MDTKVIISYNIFSTLTIDGIAPEEYWDAVHLLDPGLYHILPTSVSIDDTTGEECIEIGLPFDKAGKYIERIEPVIKDHGWKISGGYLKMAKKIASLEKEVAKLRKENARYREELKSRSGS